MKPKGILIPIILVLLCSKAFAFYENYPPYRFKDSPPKHLEAKPIVDLEHAQFRSRDGKIQVTLKEIHWDSRLSIKDGNKTLMKLHVKEAGDPPFPDSVYWVDVDGNGLKDFIVLSCHRGSGIAVNWDHVDLFLKKSGQSYQKISYDTWSSGLSDFVDLKKNGKYEVIITGYYQGKERNYFSYDIYEFKNFELVNADERFKGFPKYVWLTDKPNDKNSTHLSEKERLKYTLEKNKSIDSKKI